MTTFTATVTQTALGLPTLNINDITNYKVSSEIMGGSVQWDRRIVSSPYVNGDFTVNRRLQNVSEKFGVYVYGADQPGIITNAKALIAAFTQPLFNLTLTMDTASYTYLCEAADYTYQWSNAHMFASQILVQFQMPRQPVALVGI